MADRLANTAKQMEQAPLETRIIKLNYANASDQSAPEWASPRRGNILVEKRTNALIVVAPGVEPGRGREDSVGADSVTPPGQDRRSSWTSTPKRCARSASSGTRAA
jgi:hypothetical protein